MDNRQNAPHGPAPSKGFDESRLNLDRLVIENIDEIAYILKGDPSEETPGTITFVNARVHAILGYAPDAFVDDPSLWFRSVHPDDVPSLMESTRTLAERKQPTTRIYRLRHGVTGEYRWFEDKVVPQLDAAGHIVGQVGVARDVTDRRLAEQALLDSESRFRQLVDAMPDGIVVSDATGRIVMLSAQAEALFGYSRTELVGQPVEVLLPQGHGAAHPVGRGTSLENARSRPMAGEPDIVGRRKNGAEFPVDVALSPFQTTDGTLICATVRDISERRQLERQVRQSQKMDAVGRLAGGLAHDFNNLLTVILGYADLWMENTAEDAPSYAAIVEIRKAADRAAVLTKQLLAFGRRQMLKPSVLDFNVVVEGTMAMLRRLIGEDIQLKTVLAPDIGRVKADRNQMEQVLVNLVLNARDAMRYGGRLTISTANINVDEAFAREHPSMLPGPHVEVAVADTGTGMSIETQVHLFEPFFTTKAPGKGTGLGLSMVYGIVKQSGGSIWVSSQIGQGSTFSIYLPQVTDPLTEQDPQASQVEGSRRPGGVSETILLVEDEDSLRALARTVLVESGYVVLQAANGTEGLAMAGAHHGAIHLLITDMVMPGIGGQELAERLCEDRPGTKVLFVSGFTAGGVPSHVERAAAVAVLDKPFTPATLANRVRALLDIRADSQRKTVS